MRRRSIQSMTRRTSRITSGPMPSPGRISSFLLAGIAVLVQVMVVGSQGCAAPARAFVARDPRRVLQRLADVVEAVQQRVLAERVDVEVDLLAVRADHDLAFEVDGDARVAAEFRIVDQCVADRARQADRQQAVLEAVVVEDVAERGRDDAADAEIGQRPGGVLARRAAAEVLVRDDDLRVAVGFLVQDELGAFLAGAVEAQRVEQVHAETGALDGLQEARGDHLVGVDVLHRHRRGDGGQRGEFVHGVSLTVSRAKARHPRLVSIPGQILRMKGGWVYIMTQAKWHVVCRRYQRHRASRVRASHRRDHCRLHQAIRACTAWCSSNGTRTFRWAIQREKNIKEWPRAWKSRLIGHSNPEWRDLYP